MNNVEINKFVCKLAEEKSEFLEMWIESLTRAEQLGEDVENGFLRRRSDEEIEIILESDRRALKLLNK